MAKVEDADKTKETQQTTQVTQQQPKVEKTEVAQGTTQQDPLAALGKEDADQVRLIDSLLGEYTSTVTRASDLGESARGAFGKLHGAFRAMMALRGEAHKQAARVFIKYFESHGKKSLDYDMRCRHLDLLPHTDRGVFTGYMDLLCRFQKSDNKGQFRKNNNIDRLLGRVLDPELQESMNGVFPG